MTPPFTTPPSGYAFWAVYGVFVSLEVADAVRRRGDDRGPDLDAGSKRVLGVALGVGAGGAFALGFAAPAWATFGALATPLFWVGLTVAVAGIGVRWYSVAALGDAFARTLTVTDDQTVEDAGPYAVVRHPSYTGGLLAFVGLGLALGTWPGVLLVAATTAGGYRYRVRVEERALRAELDGYEAYCEDTPYRLVPGVW